ncbi:MAG: hypothetical protein LBH49_00355 [Puniceicoccales bacterium]|nr:hypothetical protein [Puniceicoccales bacterium]
MKKENFIINQKKDSDMDENITTKTRVRTKNIKKAPLRKPKKECKKKNGIEE